MSFQQVGKIGRPGKSGKWKQPAGTQLWQLQFNQGSSGGTNFITRRSAFDPSTSEAFFEIENSPDLTPENFILLFSRFYGEYASGGWSSTPANCRIFQRVLTSQMTPDIDPETEQSVIESANCDEGIELATSDLMSEIPPVWKKSGSNNFAPDIQISNRLLDGPTVSTLCTSAFRVSLRFLIPKGCIVRGAEGYTGQGTATLLSET